MTARESSSPWSAPTWLVRRLGAVDHACRHRVLVGAAGFTTVVQALELRPAASCVIDDATAPEQVAFMKQRDAAVHAAAATYTESSRESGWRSPAWRTSSRRGALPITPGGDARRRAAGDQVITLDAMHDPLWTERSVRLESQLGRWQSGSRLKTTYNPEQHTNAKGHPVPLVRRPGSQAAKFYTSIFKGSRSSPSPLRQGGPGQARLGDDRDLHPGGPGADALNGGPHFKFTPAISMSVSCKDQKEVDFYCASCSAGQPVECGWLTDRYGLSWQIVPDALPRLLAIPTRRRPAGDGGDDANGEARREDLQPPAAERVVDHRACQTRACPEGRPLQLPQDRAGTWQNAYDRRCTGPSSCGWRKRRYIAAFRAATGKRLTYTHLLAKHGHGAQPLPRRQRGHPLEPHYLRK